MPRRLQRRRDRPNDTSAVYVGRPTMWGNPFRADQPDHPHNRDARIAGATSAADAYRRWLRGEPGFAHIAQDKRDAIIGNISKLKGRDLSCWCRPGDDCHADVLIEAAN